MKKVLSTVVGVAATMVLAPAPNAAADVVVVARDCTGTLVPRCARLEYDNDSRRYRAVGTVKDSTKDNVNYNVDAQYALVNGIGTEEIAWHTGSDTVTTQWKDCSGRVNVTYSAILKWRNVATGATDESTLGGAGWVC